MAADNVVPIARKHRSGDVWTPVQLLEELLADIKAGKEHPSRLLVTWTETTEDGKRDRIRHWQAQCSRSEEIAFLTAAAQMAIEDWRDGR